jgi:hypothetical protein
LVRRVWLVAVAVVACVSCGTEPRSLPFSGEYLLTIDASASCAESTDGIPLPVRHFAWRVAAQSSSAGTSVFALPVASDPNGLDNLTVSLSAVGDGVTGTIVGYARVDRTVPGGYTAGFYGNRAAGTPASLVGSLERTSEGKPSSARGTLNGLISVGLYESSSGGQCAASDHTWTLISQ